VIVNQASLQSIYRSFKTIFQKAFEVAKPKWQDVATEVPSSTREEEYKWLGRVPRMREWIGERIIKNLAAHGYTIRNKDWESTVAVDRNDIEDDTVGVYAPLIQALGQAAAEHPDEIVFALFHLGFASLCYDGQYFFDAEHRDGEEAAQSNVSDKKLSADAYGAARAAMMSLVDEHGRSLGIIPDLLAVAPANEKLGREILEADRLSDGSTNVWKGTAKLMVVPELAANPDEWFVLCTTKPVKPLIFQKRKAPQFVAKDQPDDDNVFMKKEFVYGTDCRDNAGFGLWQLAYGSTGEVA
jgi:phage major head subunit gpT-like protein